jgi:hypothetical protein
MSTTFAYDSAQSPTAQPLLIANQQEFLTGVQSTTVASASNGVNVTTFTGTQTLNVASTSAINLLSSSTQNVWQYVKNSGSGLTPANTDGFLVVATSTGIALLAYQGITSTTFTGVTYVSGQPGTLATGAAVTSATQDYYICTGVASRLTGSIFSDQAGTLAILQSFDGVNWDLANTFAVVANTVNSGIDQETIAPYVSFLYSNGSTTQGVFRFHMRVFGNGRQAA